MVLFLMIALVLLNKYLYKSFLNPVFLQSLLWLVYYIILLVNIDKYHVYTSDIHPFIVLQLLGFSAGGFICYLITKRSALKRISLPESESTIVQRNLKFCYPVVLTVLLLSLFVLVRQAGSASIFGIADLRSELVEDDGKNFGVLGTIQYIIAVYLILYFSTYKKISLYFIVLLVFFLYYTLLLGSRGMFLFFFISLMYMLLWKKKAKKITLFYIGTVLISFFLLLTFLRTDSNNDTSFLFDLFLVYTVTSLPALVLTTPSPSMYWGSFTFRNLYLWLNKIGFSFKIMPMLAEFTTTPLSTNVYTYMKPYYYDFGLSGVFFIPLFLGFVINWLYFRASTGRLSSMIFLSLTIYPLVMQIFDEIYFIWFSNWLYFFIFIQIFTKVRIYEFGRSRRNVSSIPPECTTAA